MTHKINNLDVVASSLETEKSELAAELRNVQKSFKGLETEKRNLKENNSAILQELSTAQQQLHDCEVEKNELIEQIANVSNTEDNDRKANAIVIYDSISQSLKDNLSHPNMVFEYLHLDLQNPKNVTMKLQNADLVVFALGGKLIEEGVKGLTAYKMLTDVLNNLENQVYVITLPPMALKGVSSQISLFNYKLNKMTQTERLHVLDIPFLGITKDQVLDARNTYANAIMELINQEIRKIECLPLPKQPCPPSTSVSTESYEVTALVEIQSQHIGKIIGKSGSNITRIRREHKVNIAVGRWSEPKRDNRDDYAPVMDAVCVTGLSNDVRNATLRILDLTSVEGPSDPKRKKST